MSNDDRLDELDAAFADVYPGRGRVPDVVLVDDVIPAQLPVHPAARAFLHDPAEDRYVAELDADGRFTIELPGKTEVGEPPLPRCELRTDLPDPVVVFAEGFAAQLAELNRIIVEAAEVMRPAMEAWARTMADAAAHCRAVGLLPPPTQGAREELLAAKRAPGRTGPPPPRMDGRRGR